VGLKVIVKKLAFIRNPSDPEHSSAGEVEDGGIAGVGKGDMRRREGEYEKTSRMERGIREGTGKGNGK
jgi:hypothetical protein